MTAREFTARYNNALGYARRGAGVVLLPGAVNGERCTVVWAWAISPRYHGEAFSSNPLQRAAYLAAGARETRKNFERDHGLVLA